MPNKKPLGYGLMIQLLFIGQLQTIIIFLATMQRASKIGTQYFADLKDLFHTNGFCSSSRKSIPFDVVMN
jgi:hypothetical protein